VSEFRRFEATPESEKRRILEEQIKLGMPSPDQVDPKLLPDDDKFWRWHCVASLLKEKVLRRALKMIDDAGEMTMPDVIDRIFPKGLDDETRVRASAVLIELLQGGGYIGAGGDEPRRRMN
jgi:hypothetical protein